jgi:hypothetical protein
MSRQGLPASDIVVPVLRTDLLALVAFDTPDGAAADAARLEAFCLAGPDGEAAVRRFELLQFVARKRGGTLDAATLIALAAPLAAYLEASAPTAAPSGPLEPSHSE